MSFCAIKSTKFDDTDHQERQQHVYYTQSMACLLVAGWQTSPGHQQEWHWLGLQPYLAGQELIYNQDHKVFLNNFDFDFCAQWKYTKYGSSLSPSSRNPKLNSVYVLYSKRHTWPKIKTQRFIYHIWLTDSFFSFLFASPHVMGSPCNFAICECISDLGHH